MGTDLLSSNEHKPSIMEETMGDFKKPEVDDLPEREQKLFKLLERVVEKNLPCPTNDDLRRRGYTSTYLPRLARLGFIEITLHTGNIRSIKICTGQYTDMSTQKPEGLDVIRIIDHDPAAVTNWKEPAELHIPDW